MVFCEVLLILVQTNWYCNWRNCCPKNEIMRLTFFPGEVVLVPVATFPKKCSRWRPRPRRRLPRSRRRGSFWDPFHEEFCKENGGNNSRFQNSLDSSFLYHHHPPKRQNFKRNFHLEGNSTGLSTNFSKRWYFGSQWKRAILRVPEQECVGSFHRNVSNWLQQALSGCQGTEKLDVVTVYIVETVAQITRYSTTLQKSYLIEHFQIV